MTNQLSINEPVSINGLNVYTGRKNTATFHPAKENSGLVFLVDNVKIPAKLEFAEHRRKAIGLNNGEKEVHLVEHLLSAVYALGIDNLEIELSDNVCPTTNNCASEYFKTLRGVRREQTASKRFWEYVNKDKTIIRNETIRKPDCLKVNRSDRFLIDYFAYYPHKVIRDQAYKFQFSEENYAKNIMNARSPAFIKNGLFKKVFLSMGKMGLHGINEQSYLLVTSKNAEEYANSKEFGVKYHGQEFVRHKILDTIGTLALTGRQFKNTEFKLEMTGHKFDLYALKKLFKDNCFTDCSSSPIS